MSQDFTQIEWNEEVAFDCRQLIRLWVHEDLARGHDWTTLAIVDEGARAQAVVRSRGKGIICGIRAAQTALDEMEIPAKWSSFVSDGDQVEVGEKIASLSGPARDLLTVERLLLNLLGHLSGISTLTQQYVAAVSGTTTAVYDTRKTTPGWRRLEKYAVRCGGGRNHRSGLYDAILIKDNHLAFAADHAEDGEAPLLSAMRRTGGLLNKDRPTDTTDTMIMEVEVDTLEQLRTALEAQPTMVLLDNFSLEMLREACQLRDQICPKVQLEASGGIQLGTMRKIAATGVDRISVGALTHSAPNFDVGLDWGSS